jgi:hypothetical protein
MKLGLKGTTETLPSSALIHILLLLLCRMQTFAAETEEPTRDIFKTFDQEAHIRGFTKIQRTLELPFRGAWNLLSDEAKAKGTIAHSEIGDGTLVFIDQRSGPWKPLADLPIIGDGYETTYYYIQLSALSVGKTDMQIVAAIALVRSHKHPKDVERALKRAEDFLQGSERRIASRSRSTISETEVYRLGLRPKLDFKEAFKSDLFATELLPISRVFEKSYGEVWNAVAKDATRGLSLWPQKKDEWSGVLVTDRRLLRSGTQSNTDPNIYFTSWRYHLVLVSNVDSGTRVEVATVSFLEHKRRKQRNNLNSEYVVIKTEFIGYPPALQKTSEDFLAGIARRLGEN